MVESKDCNAKVGWGESFLESGNKWHVQSSRDSLETYLFNRKFVKGLRRRQM